MSPALLDPLIIDRMRALAGGGPILIGLSGGGDSTALLHLLAAALGAPALRAEIVDHGLRGESAAEAARVAADAAAAGVGAHVTRLGWAEGDNRSQARLRARRHGALYAEARRVGARVIALGHTADDQAETVLMRLERSRARRGLAGVAPLAPAPIWPEGRGLIMARPLLGARRQDLRAYLRARGAAWVEDPSNDNRAFERVRARVWLTALEAGGGDPMRLVRLAARARARAERVNAAAATLAEKAVRWDQGRALLADPPWRAGQAGARARLLAALLAAVSGEVREPDAEALAARMLGPGFSGATLGGCRIMPRRDGFSIGRDPGAVFGRAGQSGCAEMALAAGETGIWDGRLELTAGPAGAIVRADSSGQDPDAVEILRRDSDPDTTPAARGWRESAHWLGPERLSLLLFTGR